MKFGDKLKDLRSQAEQAVAENKEKIQTVVDTVGVAANEKTHGKYATKIMKVNDKLTSKVEGMAAAGSGTAAEADTADEAPMAAAPSGEAPITETPGADAPAPPVASPGGFPKFEE